MSKNGFPIKRRKFLTISVSAGIGLAIPSLIHSHEDDRAEAAVLVLGVIAALSMSLPALSNLCGVAQSILEKKLEEVKQEYGITANNNRGSIIAITPRQHLDYSTEKAIISNYFLESSVGKNLLEQPTNIANVPPEKWTQQQAEAYINGSFGQKVNQSASPKLKLWALNAYYKVGEEIAFQDKKYKCRQSHTVHAENWIPPHTQALWELIPSQ
ncbi:MULTISPECIES: carbohydrate-binding protein [unclassified Microcoleus]|uniref:carbohydrate-binding protein n=1 Tax=unclassified Microcoleus TaxID=2642155 RepID=UPI002FD1DE7F